MATTNAGRRVVLITGAGSGIGATLVRRIASQELAMVLHTGRNRERLEGVAETARERGAEVALETGDLAEAAACARLVACARERFGALDHFVSNAGFADRRRFGELDDEGFARSTWVVQTAFFRIASHALDLLAASPQGRVVAVSSFLAHRFQLGGDVFPASAAAKSGLEGLVRSLAAQLAPSGVTVNAVVPGYVEKDSGTHSSLDEAGWQRALSRVPLARLGRQEEIAAAITFLLGAEAGYITGQMLHVDGGLLL